MSLETKIFLFYIGLTKTEKKKFELIIGRNRFGDIWSRAGLSDIRNQLSHLQPNDNHWFSKDEEFDIAVMQVVRYIVKLSTSNIELSEYIENIAGTKITRPEKRSKPELQGILLEALINASKSKINEIRNKLANKVSLGKSKPEDETNLERWFTIILGRQ